MTDVFTVSGLTDVFEVSLLDPSQPDVMQVVSVGIATGGGSGEGVWGSITGTLSDQTDLQAALDGKANVGEGGAVDSVNGATGVVVLDATDVGADPAGTAASAVSAHESATTNVHGITDTSDLVYDNDARLSDDRDPTAHASSHEDGGADEIEIAIPQVTGLSSELAARLSADDARIAPSISTFRMHGDSQLTNDGSGSTGSVRTSESPIQKIAANLRVVQTENLSRPAGSGLRTGVTNDISWPWLAQVVVPPANRQYGIGGVTPGPPYTAEPGWWIDKTGANDLRLDGVDFSSGYVLAPGVNTNLGVDNSRTVMRALPHYWRWLILRVTAGALYEDTHSSMSYSGFSSVERNDTSNPCSGASTRDATADGSTVTFTIPDDVEDGTEFACCFIAQPDYYVPLDQDSNTTNGDGTQVRVSEIDSKRLPQSGNYTVLIGTDQRYVTSGQGTRTLTLNSALSQNWPSGTILKGADNLKVQFSNPDSGSWSAPADLVVSAQGPGVADEQVVAGQGIFGTRVYHTGRVPVVRRITVNKADAGKRIVMTTAGAMASSTDTVRFDNVIRSAQAPNLVLMIGIYPYLYGVLGAALNNLTRTDAANAALASVCAEFGDHVQYGDIATAFKRYWLTGTSTANNTDTTTTGATFTLDAVDGVVPEVGQLYQWGASDGSNVETVRVTAVSGSGPYTLSLARGQLGTAKATHASGHKLMPRYFQGFDNLHFSPPASDILAEVVRDTLNVSEASEESRLATTGATRVHPIPVRDTTPITPLGIRGRMYGGVPALDSVPASTIATGRIVITPPGSSTFTLTMNSVTSSAVAFNAATATVKSTIEAMSNVGSGKTLVSGSTGGPWTVDFLFGAPVSYGGNISVSAGSVVATHTTAYAVPIIVEHRCVAYKAGIRVLTAANGGTATARLAIMGDNGFGLPQVVHYDHVTDGGTPLDLTSAGPKTTTFTTPVALPPGVYWLVVKYEGTATTPPILESMVELSEQTRHMLPVSDPSGTFYGSGPLVASGSFTAATGSPPNSTTLTHNFGFVPLREEISWTWHDDATNTPRAYISAVTTATVSFSNGTNPGSGKTVSWRIDSRQNPAEFGKTGWKWAGLPVGSMSIIELGSAITYPNAPPTPVVGEAPAVSLWVHTPDYGI